MNATYLPVYQNNASLELADLLPEVVSGAADLAATLACCQQFRIRGICSLFLDGRPHDFLNDLHHSGRAFLHYLRATGDDEKVTSKSAPLFDAIASGDDRGAAEIARHSRLTWNPGEEYEDDFLYYKFLLKFFLLSDGRTECSAILERYEELLDGDPDFRFDLCQAILHNQHDDFDASLHELIDDHTDQYSILIEACSIAPECAVTEGRICLEALALVRLAERVGIAVADDYPLVPSLAREQVEIVYSEEDWRSP